MAKQTWNLPIDKHTEWSGDTSTQGLPVCGGRVEEFIKNTFEGKVGCIYYDTVYNRYMMFADDENRDLYLSNPEEYSTLLLGVFDAPFNYTATITLIDTPISQFVEYGSTGNVIKAEFDTLNKNGSSVGEAHTVNITIRNGSSSKMISRQVSYGTVMELNLDDYLLEGNNIINIQVIGNDTLAATSQVVTFIMVRLELNDYFDISYPYNANDTLSVNFEVRGSGVKHMLWWLDGSPVEHDTDVDDITASESPILTRYIPFSLSEGRHNLQFRAYVEVDGRRFYSDTHFRDFIVKTNSQKIIVTSFDYPTASGNTVINAFTMPIPLNGLKQYDVKDMEFAVYNPQASVFTTTVSFNGINSEYSTTNEEVYPYQIKPTSSGLNVLTFSATGAATISFNGIVEESDFDLYEVSNCIFRFNGTDRTNSSNNRDQWSYSGYSATFSGFTWNESNGWVGDGFLIGDGQELSFNYAPLSGVSVNNGATFEFDFSTLHVMDENTVLCDLRQNGIGILITASEAKIISRGGVEVSTKYKAGEQVRVSFVINRYSLGNNKGLVFIYVNGILSGALPYGGGESFASNTLMSFAGSDNAYIKISQIMAYDRPLTYNEIINNFILYQTSFDSLLEKYRSNDVYTEGTETLDIDKVSAKVPVIIVTGDLEQLQNTTDKNKEVMMDKIEIINMDNPTLNLTLTNAIMRPQGTSSMSYPKKNFRIYSQRNSRTKMYDYQGNEVTDRLYAFKTGAQRVKCWCLKADYAESSSAHNTGVARLWNDILKDVKISNINEHHYSDNQFVCRTQAQQIAIDSHFEGDVRTCIDGFPICLFYHLNENDPLIFVGKYNFNNDKSTESVYGFVGIPGFDNSHVECWEITENGNTLALYTNVNNYDSRWSGCFEARYPDDSGKASEATRAKQALKTFTLWVGATNGNLQKFVNEKWDHLDVYKMAAYYLYVMRFGAVDQVVKNGMLTTEDGVHWFFINYDNDTILGLRNDGLLKFGPTITRQSKDPSDPSSYCYAGHDSVLWNNLEADSEFMTIVSEMDKALYNAGLNYAAMVDMFNNKQSGKWGERIFNIDEQYKYLDVWNQTQNNQLEKLQGSRESHREWWINSRFNMYDEMNLIGAYKDNNVEIKPTSYGVTGATIKVRPSSDGHYYGYGINNTAIETGVSGTTDADITFVTPSDTPLYIGDPVRFYNAKNIGKFDASLMAPYIQEATFSNINSNGEDSFMTDVILGSSALTNNTLTQLGSISFVKYLKNLNIRNYVSITTLNLSNNKYLETLNASGCTSLASVILPDAAPVTALTLPANMQSLIIKDLNGLTFGNFSIDGLNSINTITVQNCPGMVSSTGFTTMLMNWYNNKTTDNSECSVKINNIDWTMTYNDMFYLGQINAAGGHLELQGRVRINATLTPQQISTLMDLYGNNCFDQSSSFYFTFIVSPLQNLAISLNKSIVSKNDNIVATVSFSGNDFKNVEFAVNNSAGITIVKNGLSATIYTDSNVSMRNVTLTATVTKTNNSTESVSTTFDIVPYYFYINNINFTDDPEFELKYKYGESAKTFFDGWTITCDDANLDFTITDVTVSGGTASYTGHRITYIYKTALGDNVEYPCTVSLSFNNFVGVYNFDLKTVIQGNVVKAVFSVINTSNPTVILNKNVSLPINKLAAMKIDGVSVEPTCEFLFSTIGRHTVEYEFDYDYNLTYAWNGNTTIVEVDLGEDFAVIGEKAFKDCRYLNKIFIYNKTAPTISADTFQFTTYANNNKLYLTMDATGYDTTNWTTYLLNPSYGNFNTDLALGWTCPSIITVRSNSSGASVDCPFVNNTGKQIQGVGITCTSQYISFDITTTGFTLYVDSAVTTTFNTTIYGSFTFTDGSHQNVTEAIMVDVVDWFKPMAIVAASQNNTTIRISGGSQTTGMTFDVDYAIVNDYNYGDMDTYDFDNVTFTRITTIADAVWVLTSGQTLFLKSRTMNRWALNTLQTMGVLKFSINMPVYLDGKISALIHNQKDIRDSAYNNAFSYVFVGTPILTIPELDIENLGRETYYGTFNQCGNLSAITADKVANIKTLGVKCFFSTFNIIGNLKSVDWVLPATVTDIPEGAFYSTFGYCGLQTYFNTDMFKNVASATGYQCLYRMFYNSGIKTLPNLPMQLVSPGGGGDEYREMFKGCGGITNANMTISTTTVGGSSFRDMFSGCTNMTAGPTILATTANGSNSMFGMFQGCTSLVNAPDIRILTLQTGTCQNMFYECTSLTGAPIISATTVNSSSMQEMFYGCSSLVVPPTINVVNVNGSFPMAYMFYDCTSLATIPYLPATNLSNSNYAYFTMFHNCTGLTQAPDLSHITTLGSACLRGMFESCSHLAGTLILPSATATTSECYQYILAGCAEITGLVIPALGTFDALAIDAIGNLYSLNSLTFKAMQAPVKGTGAGQVDLYQTYVFDTDTGTWSASGGTNTIYVPQGSTGWATADWLQDMLDPNKGNFTISYTAQ